MFTSGSLVRGKRYGICPRLRPTAGRGNVRRRRVDLDCQAFLNRAEVDNQEAHVFRLLSEGYHICEIADRLDVSDPRVC